MAFTNPPAFQQAATYPAIADRLTTQALYSTSGIIGSASLAVTAQASPNMTVNVASGYGVVIGANVTNQGAYVAYNDATIVATITTADVTNPRIDIVVMQIADTFYGGATNSASIVVVKGTAAASPTAPATPTNALLLATIAVAANTTTITSGNITNNRVAVTTSLPVLPLTGGTLTGGLKVASSGAGSTVPVSFQSGTLTTAAGGNLDYDGNALYVVPNSGATASTSGGRATVVSSHHYSMNSSNISLLVQTAAQPVLSISGGSGLSLATNTFYEVEGFVQVQFTNTTTGTVASLRLNYTGTTAGNPYSVMFDHSYALAGSAGHPTTTQYRVSNGLNANTAMHASFTNNNMFVSTFIKGTFRTTSTGTLTLQIAFSSVATVTVPVTVGSGYLKVTPLGAAGVTQIGAWA